MKLIQKSNFRVQGMFFEQLKNCIEKNQNTTHFEEGTSESPPWNFSENSFVFESPPVFKEPYPALEVIKSSILR